MANWAKHEHPARVIFDTTDPEEIRLRNPMEFAASLQIPLILYSESGGMDQVNSDFCDLVKRSGKDCELVVTDGDHMSMVAPAVQHAIKWFRKHAGK